MGTDTSERRYWPALDGMRAVAVLLVVAYHGQPTVMPRGGSIGVTLFFTLSGFLITSLLLRERQRSGRIRLRRFYWRRALRLLPALATLVLVTSAYALVTGNQSPTLDAAVPVLLYVGNWMRTLHDTDGLGLLEHTWSLSVEEQFYLVWPLAVLAAAAFVSRARQAEAVLVLAVGGSLASLLWRLQLWNADEPRWSAARLYNGTDAVADQLLVGAALAAALALWDRREARRATESRPDPDDAAAPMRARALPVPAWLVGGVLTPLALAYVVWVARYRPGGATLDNDRRYLEYGSLTFAIAGAVIVLGATRAERSWLPRLLALPALVAIGKVSYGIYLWHFPVILVVDEQLPDASTPARATAVLVGTAALTVASWVLVERPFLALKDGPRTAVPARATEPVGSTRT